MDHLIPGSSLQCPLNQKCPCLKMDHLIPGSSLQCPPDQKCPCLKMDHLIPGSSLHPTKIYYAAEKKSGEDGEKKSEKMVKRSRVTFSKVKVGDNVTVPIPSVDHGRTDPRNIIGIIIAVSENNMYTVAVKGGVLNGRYSRNQFDVRDSFCSLWTNSAMISRFPSALPYTKNQTVVPGIC